MTSHLPTEYDAALEPVHVVLPMRTISGGKARLGEALDAEEREELVLGLLLHTLAVLAEWRPCRHIHLVSPDPVLDAATRGAGVPVSVHRQVGGGLNEGVRLGIEVALAAGAASLLVLPGDLPHLSTEALDELITAADAGLAAAAGGPLVAIAPSDARSGTNALLLRPPDVIAPAFGNDSFEAHLRAAEAADASVQVVSDAALGFDLDTPEDLERLDPARLRELMAWGRAVAERVEA
ncbi:MAG TPA: 2-phospho-L-lactate guanylyltransferase [Candidatus Limnocylindrales bacterium]|nr:2-phospho-L-lactate guanylyltransferase [Candidatus Limnocylindrales bacterium]